MYTWTWISAIVVRNLYLQLMVFCAVASSGCGHEEVHDSAVASEVAGDASSIPTLHLESGAQVHSPATETLVEGAPVPELATQNLETWSIRSSGAKVPRWASGMGDRRRPLMTSPRGDQQSTVVLGFPDVPAFDCAEVHPAATVIPVPNATAVGLGAFRACRAPGPQVRVPFGMMKDDLFVAPLASERTAELEAYALRYFEGAEACIGHLPSASPVGSSSSTRRRPSKTPA